MGVSLILSTKWAEFLTYDEDLPVDDLHKEVAQWVTCWSSVADNGSQWNTILMNFWKAIYVW